MTKQSNGDYDVAFRLEKVEGQESIPARPLTFYIE